jgi:Kef-type K+ transport system membrane component KefB
VHGRLRIQGPFLFVGLILASGGIEVTGQDVTVYGAILSAGSAGVTWRASGELRRSTCAVARVSNAAARPYPVPYRGWAELF